LTFYENGFSLRTAVIAYGMASAPPGSGVPVARAPIRARLDARAAIKIAAS
jgi:hypothetical protein